MARVISALSFVALFLLSGASLAEEPADPAYTSLTEARRVAAKEGKLLFVYLDPTGLDQVTLERCEALPEAALSAAAERLIVVRIDAGVTNPESVMVRTRYELFDSVAAGAVIDPSGACFGLLHGDCPLDLQTTLDTAERLAAEYRAEVERLGGCEDDAGRRALAAHHLAHYAFEHGVLVMGRVDRTGDLSADELSAYARGFARLGRLDAAERLFRRHLEEFPDDPQRGMVYAWLATLRICPARVALRHLGRFDPDVHQQGFDAIDAFLEERRAAGDVGGEAVARFHLLHFLDDHLEHLAECLWIVENDPQGLVAGDAWWRLVEFAVEWNDPELAVLHLESLLAARPDDDQYAEVARSYRDELEQYIEAAFDPANRPFALRIELSDEPGVGDTVTLTARVTNRSEQGFSDVAIGCLVEGPVRLASRPLQRLERLGPQAEVSASFELEILEPGVIHVLAAVRQGVSEETGYHLARHLRIDIVD